jgi:outer membrane protein assembly factor BamD
MSHLSRNLCTAALLAGSLFLFSCASKEEAPDDRSEQVLYEAAAEQLDTQSYARAISNLQMLEARFPFGPYAEQAQLELIFAYYKIYDNAASIETAERFVRLHPQHPNVDYAYYMRGLANYNEGKGIIERFSSTDLTERDPGAARQSFNDFSQLVTRFPNSEYAPDARYRMIHLRNLLARYEINVANYYLRRRAFIGALNRGRFVVENFPQSPSVPDALAVMVQSYLLLELDDLANDSLTVLRDNYPDHPNLDKNGNFIPAYTARGVKPTWVSRITLGLVGRQAPREINYKKKYENF